MSIASEITRINTNIANAYTACSNKGATLPATQNSANLASCIGTITPQFDYGFDNTGKLVWANPNIYLQSSGTQYINTGILADDTTGVYADVLYLSNADTVIIGSRPSSSGDNRFYIGRDTGYSTSKGWYLAWNSLGTRFRPEGFIRTVVSMNLYNDRKKYIDDTLLENITETLATQYSNVTLFGANVDGTISYKSTAKLYSAKITQGSTLVRHFVPVPQGLVIGSYTCASDGMWDIVNQQFYGNSGTGTFVYGR